MRRGRTCALILALTAILVVPSSASAPIGIYGIVERMVFEPDDKAPERIQVWGAFAHADGRSYDASSVERGYLYFQLPDLSAGIFTRDDIDLMRREWADLAAVAGTGTAIAFGRWNFVYLATGGQYGNLRVRPASEAPASPATYHTNAGIVKLSEAGSHAAIVAQLRARLRAPQAKQ